MAVSLHEYNASVARALIESIGDNRSHFSSQGSTVRAALKEMHIGLRNLGEVTVAGITSGVTDMTPYFKLAGRSGGQIGHGGTASTDRLTLRGNTVATIHDWIKIPIFTASTSASPDTNRILRIETSDAVNIFNVQGDGATTITAPYTTYVSGNPILLTLQMDDATSSPSTIFRVRTQSANVFTISYTGGTLIDMATDNVGLEVQGGGATANIVQFRTSTPTTVFAIGPTGLTSHSPTAVGNLVSIKAFSTAATNVFIDFQSSAAASIGRVVLSSAVPRLLLGTTTLSNSIINVVPPSVAIGASQTILRAVWTDSSATNGYVNGLIQLAPTLSDATNGVPGGNFIIVNPTANNAIGDMNAFEINMVMGEEDALTGGGTTVGRALHFEAKSTAGTLSALRGFQGGARHASAGTIADLAGGSYYCMSDNGSGTATNAAVLVCLDTSAPGWAGSATNFYGFWLQNQSIIGSATNNYGLKIDARSGGTNVWSMHVSGSAVSVHNPKLGIGATTTPTALLHLAAGTTAANTAPLKFTSGSLNTSAEAGTHEYDGSYHYLTNGTPMRGAVATTANVVVDMGGDVVTTMDGEVLLAA